MSVPGPIRIAIEMAGAFVLAAAIILMSVAPLAAAGPNLPPAEYKPLPVDTQIKYDNRSYEVTRTEGFLYLGGTNEQ